jgi:DNA-binding transcriptional MocR family regulator
VQARDAVAVESPCFYACLQALERLGLRAVEVATDPRTGMDLDALEHCIARHQPAACWVMTNFQNPLAAQCRGQETGAGRTGTSPSDAADRG